MNQTFLKLGLLGVTWAGSFSQNIRAQGWSPDRPVSDRDLNERVRRLERQNENLERNFRNFELEVTDRLRRIERDIGDGPVPVPVDKAVVCRIRDSYKSSTFLGRGKTELSADAIARQECQKSLHSSYCSTGKSQCEVEQPWGSATCVVTDAYKSGTYMAEAPTEVEAAHKAQKACEASLHSSYCATTPRCETTERAPANPR